MTEHRINIIMNDREFIERTWQENFSMIPPLDKMSMKQREELKEFTLKIFREGLKQSLRG